MEDLPLNRGISDKQPLDVRTVDPKASKKSTSYVKVVEVGEFLKNPKAKQDLEDVVEIIKDAKFDAKEAFEAVEEFLKNPKAKQELEEVLEFIKNPISDVKQVLERAGEILKNPKAQQEFEEVLESIKNPSKFTGLGGKVPELQELKQPSSGSMEDLPLKRGISDKQPLDVDTVDPKASKKSTIFEKEVVEILLEEAVQLLKNPRIKQELEEVLEFLQNPTKFTGLGGKFPKGIILLRYLFALVIEELYEAKVPEVQELKQRASGSMEDLPLKHGISDKQPLDDNTVDPKASKNSIIFGKEVVEILVEEAVEVLEFLQNPTKFTGLGGKFPKGIILLRYLFALIEELYQDTP